MLIDQAIIKIRSGKGGDGRVSFRREKFIPKGGPSGGDGGDGGSIYFRVDPNVDTLLDFAGRHDWHAQDGEMGGTKQCGGKDGADRIIPMPPGTLVYDQDSGKLIVDLNQPGELVLIARGGRGGFGNDHFKSPTNQAPRTASLGEPAREMTLRLELKLIADLGLLGKPNAGKSSLLAAVSRAHPKIADYPFTTLEPQLGIAEISNTRRMVMADIPGLIQGAAGGAGLGVKFLRHIERTRLLVHLLEIEPADGSDPVENYQILRKELRQYSQELAKKPEILVISKMDLLASDEDRAAAVELLEKELGQKVLAISSATGLGLPELLEACWKRLAQEPKPDSAAPRTVAAKAAAKKAATAKIAAAKDVTAKDVTAKAAVDKKATAPSQSRLVEKTAPKTVVAKKAAAAKTNPPKNPPKKASAAKINPPKNPPKKASAAKTTAARKPARRSAS